MSDDFYKIGGYIPISGEFVRAIERGEPVVLWIGGFDDEDACDDDWSAPPDPASRS